MQSQSGCLFCKIVKKEIPADIVYEDPEIMVFNDIAPQAPTHLLVIPKKHIETTLQLKGDDYQLIANIFKTINTIAKQSSLAKNGFRVVNNCLSDGGQLINHLHFHVLGGRALQWPPG